MVRLKINPINIAPENGNLSIQIHKNLHQRKSENIPIEKGTAFKIKLIRWRG